MGMVTALKLPATLSATPLRAAPALNPATFHELRRSLVLDGCKWDPQVGDVETISRFPLLLSADHWRSISNLARSLASELTAAEQELPMRPELRRTLGLTRRIRSILKDTRSIMYVPCPVRVLRFDFHWTNDGWRISEVNSDVPGGYAEASALAKFFARHFPECRPAGDPGAIWADAMSRSVDPSRPVAILAATGFMEDQQVAHFLERLLVERGFTTRRTPPEHIRWHDGFASLDEPLGAIVRFYQAEWLNPKRDRCLFVGGRTPVTNPAIAMLTESKRFPLTWHALSTPLPTWRRMLPETRDPRDAPWKIDDGWLLKSSFCNTGDTVAIRSLLSDGQWRSIRRQIWLNPTGWIAQRRFETEPLASDAGLIYPCIGVYTIDGEPAGIYGRYSRTPIIDYAAVDAAVLVEDESAE